MELARPSKPKAAPARNRRSSVAPPPGTTTTTASDPAPTTAVEEDPPPPRPSNLEVTAVAPKGRRMSTMGKAPALGEGLLGGEGAGGGMGVGDGKGNRRVGRTSTTGAPVPEGGGGVRRSFATPQATGQGPAQEGGAAKVGGLYAG
jgi:hypothetical protein